MLQPKTIYKAVIFDLDGTLINSLHDIADSMNRVLVANGFQTHNYDAYRYFVGRGLRVLVGRTLPEEKRTEETISTLYSGLLKDYEKNCLGKTALYQGISEMLDSLMARSLRLAILSNKADDFTQKIVGELLFRWPFEVTLGSKEGLPRKPDPTSALLISQKLGLSPEEILYVGDTGVDMTTAVAAGMYPVGVSWGFRSKEELLENGAKAIINSPAELLELLNPS